MCLVRLWGLTAAAALAATGFAPALADGASRVKAATTTGYAERVDTIPITRRAGAKPRVAISLGPRRIPTLRKDDRLRALGEVQVTTTCVISEPRCIGRQYSFDPRIRAWLVVGRSSRATGGASVKRISEPEVVECGQRRPNRNHHCVLVVSKGGMTVRSPGRLPCQPARCHLNLVVSAHHPSERRVHRKIPMDRSGSGWTSVYSVKLPNLRAGDVITAQARQILEIDQLGNAVFDSSRMVLAQGRRKVKSGRIARRSGAPADFTEANGFNCTQGPSAYRTPCVSSAPAAPLTSSAAAACG